jgi:hypothetical protein
MDSGLDAARRPGMTRGKSLPKNKNPGIAAGVLHFLDRLKRDGT